MNDKLLIRADWWARYMFGLIKSDFTNYSFIYNPVGMKLIEIMSPENRFHKDGEWKVNLNDYRAVGIERREEGVFVVLEKKAGVWDDEFVVNANI